MAALRHPARSQRSFCRTPCSCSRPARRSTCSETRHRVSGAHCRLRRLRNRAARLAARSKAVGLRRRSLRVGLPRRDAARCGLACSLRCARQGPPYAGCAGRGGPAAALAVLDGCSLRTVSAAPRCFGSRSLLSPAGGRTTNLNKYPPFQTERPRLASTNPSSAI